MKSYQVAVVLLVAGLALILASGTLSYYQSLVHGACAHYVYDDDEIVFVFIESQGAAGLFFIAIAPDDTESIILTDLDVSYNLTGESGLIPAPANSTVNSWRDQMSHFYTFTHRFLVKVTGPHGNVSLPLARPCIKPSEI